MNVEKSANIVIVFTDKKNKELSSKPVLKVERSISYL